MTSLDYGINAGDWQELGKRLANTQSQSYHAQLDVQELRIRLRDQRVLDYDVYTDTFYSPLRRVFGVQLPRTFWQRLVWLVTGR